MAWLLKCPTLYHALCEHNGYDEIDEVWILETKEKW
jgi:hypothetical protein